jgi:basic membrane protein A and related proteins
MAKEYPQIKFGAIDFELSAPNVASFVYREQEADFVMGVLAANLTKTRMVGVIGGTDIPAIRRIMSGYQKGVAFQNPAVTVFSDFAGTFSDPDLGYKLASSRYGQGVDIIHNAASRTGLGIIEAAKQAGKYTTGTSGDQRYLAPDNVIGNRPKRVDTAISLLIEDVKNGAFKPGVHSLGLKEEGFTFGPFNETLVTPDQQNKLNLLKNQIIQGTIIITGD